MGISLRYREYYLIWFYYSIILRLWIIGVIFICLEAVSESEVSLGYEY